MTSGYVYAIGIVGSNLVKIGISQNPASRLKTLQQSMPYTLVLLHQMWREDAGQIERKLHRILQERQQRGEWFDLLEPDLEGLFAEAVSRIECRPLPPKLQLLGKHIGALVRQRRKAMKLTQEDLEAASGIPQGTISRIEREEAEDLNVSTLIAFAEALGMTPNDMLGWEASVKQARAPKRARAKTKAVKG